MRVELYDGAANAIYRQALQVACIYEILIL